MTRDHLREVGRALYGDRWQSPLARDLGVAVRTIQRWDAGDRGIPETLGADLGKLVAARIGKLKKLAAALS